MPAQPTPRQKQILDFIARSVEERGFPPALREIAGRFELSLGAVQDRFAALEAKGFLKRERGQARGLALAAKAALGLPILGQVPAGTPIEAIEDVEGRLTLDKSLARNADYLLRVKGHSMLPELVPGDMVMVRRAPDADSGALVIAHVDGAEATVKRLRRNGRRAWLQPANPDYPPITAPFTVIGKVVGLIRSYGA